jgi:hypothetical protein
MINKMVSIVRDQKPHPGNCFRVGADWMGMSDEQIFRWTQIKKNIEINPFQVDRKTSNTEKVKLHSTEDGPTEEFTWPNFFNTEVK